MSINLLRNSKVFFTTNLESVTPGDATRGHVKLTGHTSSTTYEIQVLDDLSFSQTTAVETIGVNETGTQPIRGQRSFNTALNPVDFNFTTYMRPVEQTTIGTITSFTATLNDGTAKTLLVYVSGTEPAWNDATNYTDQYGPNTIVVSPIPANYTTGSTTVVGRAATIIPVFGTDSAKADTYGKLVGFKLINGGAAYQTSTTGFQVIDPDSTAESATITIEVTGVSTTGASKVTCEESVLWNAMFAGFNPTSPGTEAIGGNGSAWVEQSGGTDPSYVRLTKSAAHQLQPFALIVIFDQNVFLLDDCSLNTATIDFGIDAIASIQWSGQARQVRRLNAPVTTYNTTNKYYEWSGTSTLNGHYKSKITDAAFLANKLSTVTLWSKIGKHDDSNVAQKSTYNSSTSPNAPKKYTMPLTGGSITLTNNISYLTPAYMGSINQPVTYFTGSRSITGSLTAYLRTGTGNDNTSRFSANLFSDLMDNITQDSDPEFYLTINIGGEGNNKVELDMPGVVLTIPTVNAEQVVTTTVNFTAQGTGTGAQAGVDSEVFDILNNNEIKIRYYA